jgi:hypothetical protein
MIVCLSAICVLGVVALGLLVMVQAISIEQLMEGLGKCLLLIVIFF